MVSARAAGALYVAYGGQVSSSGIVPPAIAVIARQNLAGYDD